MVRSFNQEFEATSHGDIEDIAEDWIKQHVNRNDGRAVLNIEFPKISTSEGNNYWMLNAVVEWKQGFLGSHFRSFHVPSTKIYLEFDSAGNLRRHDLPKEFFNEDRKVQD